MEHRHTKTESIRSHQRLVDHDGSFQCSDIETTRCEVKGSFLVGFLQSSHINLHGFNSMLAGLESPSYRWYGIQESKLEVHRANWLITSSDPQCRRRRRRSGWMRPASRGCTADGGREDGGSGRGRKKRRRRRRAARGGAGARTR